MAGSVCKVILIGNLGRDPEIKSFQNGGRVCNLSVATSEVWKDKGTGDRRERTEWNRVVIFNENLVGVAERFLKKGSKVYIEGQLETRKYEKDGREAFTTEIVLRPYRGELTLLDGPSDREGASQAGDDGGFAGSYGGGAERPSRASAGDQGRAGTRASPPLDDDLSDSIPF
ncbi:single-stranded DNA-binding protein [Xanthobacter sp. V3C-3]|uniref:single-stranded DNA-binding protein n=1 Tax=Xanthobacter lutulentifluminis TaxID=3119935 RepID=UPI00372AB98C